MEGGNDMALTVTDDAILTEDGGITMFKREMTPEVWRIVSQVAMPPVDDARRVKAIAEDVLMDAGEEPRQPLIL